MRHILFLIGIFTLTVVVRMPHFARPISKHHEFSTATVLLYSDAWRERGFTALHGAPTANLAGEGNQGCMNVGFFADKGDFYYLSHGPLLFYAVHALRLWLGEAVRAEIIVNCFLHLLTLFWLSRLLQLLYRDVVVTRLGLVLYAFSPILLWCHGNCVVHEAAVFPFFYGSFYCFLQLFLFNNNTPNSSTRLHNYALGLFINLFLGIYTDWLCLGLALVLLVFVLFQTPTKGVKAVFWASLFSLLAVGLIVWQYAQIAGATAYLDYLQQRMLYRSIASSNPNNSVFLLFARWIGFHLAGFTGVIVLLLGGFIRLFFIKMPFTKTSILNHYFKQLAQIIVEIISLKKGNFDDLKDKNTHFLRFLITFLLFLATALTYELLSIEFSGTHDYGVMKSIAFLLPLSLVLLRFITKKQAAIAVFIVTVINLNVYFIINPLGATTFNGDRYDTVKRYGEQIRKHAAPDDVVLLHYFEQSPQMVYYAHHNIHFLSNPKQQSKPYIDSLVATRNCRRAFFFKPVASGDSLQVVRLR